MDIKLVGKDSAGTVTTLYVSEQVKFMSVTYLLRLLTILSAAMWEQMITEGHWQVHDEIDLEFLGNSTGEPYTLHKHLCQRNRWPRKAVPALV